MDGSALGVRPSAISSPNLCRDAPTSCRRSAEVGGTKGGAQSTVLALSLALGLISLITKLLLLPADFSGLVAGVRWLLRLLIIVSADLAFVLCLAWVCGLTTLVLGRWPRVQSTWRFVVVAVYAMAGLQAVASVPMLQTLVAPFSIRLIVLAGGPVMMTSSVLQHVSLPLVIGMLAALTAVAAAPRVLARWAWFRALARNPLPVAGVATFLVLAFYTACQYYIATHWTDPKRWERRIAQSPQAVLLISCVEELVKPEPFTQAFSFSQSDDSDFTDASPPGAAQQSLIEIPVEKRPRNLLLVILESTAAEYLSLYGGKHPTTPRLERLASENGLVFENVYAQAPASWKSLIGLMASTYCRPDWRMIVEDCPNFDVPTLPEVLARRGFETCFLHAGYWDWRGGEQFLKRRGVQTLIDAHQLPSAPVNSWGTSDRAMLQRALEWIDVHRDTPFFVCACTIETHHPYAPVAKPHDFGVADADFNRYLNALRTTDENLAWLMQQLARRGLESSTLVAITADHGENFGQHGQRVHGFDLYEPSIHVPLVLLHPCLAGLPKRDRRVHQHVDLPVTLLDLLGIEPPAEWQGRSMLSDSGERRAYFYAVADQVVLGLRDGDYKYHYYVDTGHEELFDLGRDRAELHNLAADRPAKAAEYKRRLGGFVSFQREFLKRHGGHKVAGRLQLGRQKKGIGYDTTGRFRHTAR